MDGSAAPVDEASIRGAIHDGTLLWLDVIHPVDDDVALLRDALELHPLAVEDLTEFGQRPKIEDFGNLVYMVSYGLRGEGNDLTEVHTFYSYKFLVTVRHDG